MHTVLILSHAPHTEKGTLTVTLSNNAHIKLHTLNKFSVWVCVYTCIYKTSRQGYTPPSLFLSFSLSFYHYCLAPSDCD